MEMKQEPHVDKTFDQVTTLLGGNIDSLASRVNKIKRKKAEITLLTTGHEALTKEVREKYLVLRSEHEKILHDYLSSLDFEETGYPMETILSYNSVRISWTHPCDSGPSLKIEWGLSFLREKPVSDFKFDSQVSNVHNWDDLRKTAMNSLVRNLGKYLSSSETINKSIQNIISDFARSIKESELVADTVGKRIRELREESTELVHSIGKVTAIPLIVGGDTRYILPRHLMNKSSRYWVKFTTAEKRSTTDVDFYRESDGFDLRVYSSARVSDLDVSRILNQVDLDAITTESIESPN